MMIPRRKLLLAAPALVLPYRRADAQFALPGISGPGTPALNTGGPAAWTLIATATGSGKTPPLTSTTVNTTTANLLIISIIDYGINTVVSDSKSNTWTSWPANVNGHAFADSKVFYSVPTTVGSGHTFTYSCFGDGYAGFIVYAFKSATGTPFREGGGNGFSDGWSGTGTTSVPSGYAATPSITGDLALALLNETSTTGAPTINSGYSAVDFVPGSSNNFSCATAWKSLPTTAPTQPTWTSAVTVTAPGDYCTNYLFGSV